MEYLSEIKVRGYHADFYGHVNNARYLEFLEEDRWASFESKIDLKQWAREGLIFLVVNINIDYRKAVPVGEVLVVSTELNEIGNRSASLKQQILFKESGEIAAEAIVTFVIMNKSGKVVAIEGKILEELDKLQLS